MTLKYVKEQVIDGLRAGTILLTMWQMGVGGSLMAQDAPAATASPIQHVIVIIGENRTFDHIFATYKPVKGQTVDNLLSKGIVNSDGSPGPNYSLAQQNSADVSMSPIYEPSPTNKTVYPALPAPLAGGPTDVCTDNGVCTLND